ncbi:MAG: Arm DNA-binding domain-containing protein [Gammaproteobacteria bacterium]
MKLTKTLVDKLVFSSTGNQTLYRDSELRGFALRVTQKGVKSFIVEKRNHKKLSRITLGRYGDLTVEQARKEAQKVLGKMATGVDPIGEKRQITVQKLTLQEVFADYLKARRGLKAKTRLWFPVRRRITYIKSHQLAAWYNAITQK